MAKTALITGASSGIGYYMCESFAKRGYNLVIVARNTQSLQERKMTISLQYGVKVLPITMDLALPGAAQNLYDKVCARNIQIDVLVNNAGFGNFGKYAQTSWEKERDMIYLNVLCTAELTKLYLKDMVKRGRGKVLNVASTAAFFPGPMMAVYYATKAFILSFSQAVSRELEGTGVSVTVLCPGPTDTGFTDAANLRKSKLYHYFKNTTAAKASKVAEYGVRASLRNEILAIHGMTNKLLIFASRFIPRKTVTEIVYNTQDTVDSEKVNINN